MFFIPEELPKPSEKPAKSNAKLDKKNNHFYLLTHGGEYKKTRWTGWYMINSQSALHMLTRIQSWFLFRPHSIIHSMFFCVSSHLEHSVDKTRKELDAAQRRVKQLSKVWHAWSQIVLDLWRMEWPSGIRSFFFFDSQILSVASTWRQALKELETKHEDHQRLLATKEVIRKDLELKLERMLNRVATNAINTHALTDPAQEGTSPTLSSSLSLSLSLSPHTHTHTKRTTTCFMPLQRNPLSLSLSLCFHMHAK